MLPEYFKLMYTADQIAEASARLGAQIGKWAQSVYDKTKQDVIAIPVLRGGIFFFADLARQVPTSLQVLPGRTRAYKDGINAGQLEEVKVILDSETLKGRSILLVDDICDSGRTMHVLEKFILEKGATEVKAAVMVHRVVENEIYLPEWRGFEYEGKEWFVGYGMEDENRWVNLPNIYLINK